MTAAAIRGAIVTAMRRGDRSVVFAMMDLAQALAQAGDMSRVSRARFFVACGLSEAGDATMIEDEEVAS